MITYYILVLLCPSFTYIFSVIATRMVVLSAIFQFGGQRYHEVERTRVKCEVLDGIECYGDRTFMSIKEYPCIK